MPSFARRALLAICGAAGLAGAAVRAGAQATLTTSATSLALPAPTATQYNSQYTAVGQISFKAASCPTTGTGCSVTIVATTPTFGPSQPIEHLEWQLNGTAAGQWHPMSAGVPGEVVSIPPGGSLSGTIYFHVLLSWSQDVADQLYTSGIRLAITQR